MVPSAVSFSSKVTSVRSVIGPCTCSPGKNILAHEVDAKPFAELSAWTTHARPNLFIAFICVRKNAYETAGWLPTRRQAQPQKNPRMQDLAFRTLLYRYFFFSWLFKDVTQGNVLERAASWRYNQRQAHWLSPTCGAGSGAARCLGLGHLVELLLNSPGFSACFYVSASLSVPVNAVIGAAWLGLKALPGPF